MWCSIRPSLAGVLTGRWVVDSGLLAHGRVGQLSVLLTLLGGPGGRGAAGADVRAEGGRCRAGAAVLRSAMMWLLVSFRMGNRGGRRLGGMAAAPGGSALAALAAHLGLDVLVGGACAERAADCPHDLVRGR
ncbi:hypothetical protein GCM10022420_092320 [Streptomyces iranensis]